MSAPLISVIMPFYLVEQYIAECIESILGQTYSNFEILCVDDCGGDDSRKIVEQFQENDPRVHLVSHQKNKGLGAARNTGLSYAVGKYTTFVDSDDWLELTFLEDMVAAAEQSGLPYIQSCNYFFDETTKEKRASRIVLSNGAHHMTPELAAKLGYSAWGKLYRTDFLRNNGLLFPEGIVYEDISFYAGCCSCLDMIYQIDKPLYVYRQRSGSIMDRTRQGNARYKDAFQSCLFFYEFLCRQRLFDTKRQYLPAIYSPTFQYFACLKQCKKEAISLAKTVLPQCDFPEKYDTRETHIFNALHSASYQKSRFMWHKYKIISALCKLLPSRVAKKKWRAWAQIKYLER